MKGGRGAGKAAGSEMALNHPCDITSWQNPASDWGFPPGIHLQEVDSRLTEVTVPIIPVRWARMLCIPKFMMPHLPAGQRLWRCDPCHACPSQNCPPLLHTQTPPTLTSFLLQPKRVAMHPGTVGEERLHPCHPAVPCPPGALLWGVWGVGEPVPRLQPLLSSLNLPISGDMLQKSHR